VNTIPTVSVIGAGLSGLAAARSLKEQGIDCIIYEKSRSYGGRCASRLWNQHVVDHGVPFFDLGDPDFEKLFRSIAGPHGLEIEEGIEDESGRILNGRGARGYHAQGNNRFARALADGLTVFHEHTASSVRRSREGWLLEFAEGKKAGPYRHLILTCPWPQSAHLLGLPRNNVRYDACLTAFFSYLKHPHSREGCFAVESKSGPVAWSALENQKKGRIRDGEMVFVAHSSPAFAAEYFEAGREMWAEILQQEVEKIWSLDPAKRIDCFTHRWKFSKRHSPGSLPELPEGILLAGDSCCESDVCSVLQSGQKAAGLLING
jgi:renalase